MNINELIKCLQRVAEQHPNADIYFGHSDGSGIDEEVYLIGEYVDETLTNHRCCCIGEHRCNHDKFEVIDFDKISN
jgi:hypothetical protein